jgi:hypothetical protein
VTLTARSRRVSLGLVFLISRRCNLECTYCNVDAGPRSRTALDPRRLEAWVQAVGELGDVDLGIQLHGGEPLMLEPSVELLASITRNALIPFPSSSIGSIGIVTNGTLLDPDRAKSLIDAGLRVVVSLDGPQQVHDRHRRTSLGRGSHGPAMRGLAALRAVDPDPPVIAVVSELDDVQLALQFFISEALSRVKINPVRLEGRGAKVGRSGVAAHMVAMADAYFDAAQTIAAPNLRDPEQPIYEENIAGLMARVIDARAAGERPASWTLLVDETGRLWSHPGGYGVDHMALMTSGPPSAHLLSTALGLAELDRAAGMMSRQRATFRACAGCPEPMWCAGFRPVTGGPAVSPDCAWRERLTSRLARWWQESPSDAIAVLPLASNVGPRYSAAAPTQNVVANSCCSSDRPMAPVVSALLAETRVSADGRRYFANYADRVLDVCGLDPLSEQDTFLQLAALAQEYAAQPDRIGLAQSLARLARLGLEPLARGRH